MTRLVLALALLVGFAVSASAAIVVDPTDPANSSKTVFTAQGLTGTTLGGEFQLSTNAIVTASLSGTGGAVSYSLFQLADTGGTVVASGTIIPVGPTTAFAFISETVLAAGTYVLSVTGSFASAALSGEVSAQQVVPLPGAVLLFGSALVGLAAFRRIRAA